MSCGPILGNAWPDNAVSAIANNVPLACVNLKKLKSRRSSILGKLFFSVFYLEHCKQLFGVIAGDSFCIRPMSSDITERTDIKTEWNDLYHNEVQHDNQLFFNITIIVY